MLKDTLSGSTPSPILRRLATILAADVAGYSRMMGEDEEATVITLRSHRAVFDALLAQHYGRVFNTAGDAILAEFPSAVEAVRCATEIQAALQTRNQRLPPDRKMNFRMGINIGDVVVQDNDLLGDGVNIAARLQTLAEPGGVCISGSVYDQIQNKLSLHFLPLGDQSLKNIERPIRTYSIAHGEAGTLPSRARIDVWKRLALAGFAAILVLAIGAGIEVYRQSREAVPVSRVSTQSTIAKSVEGQSAPKGPPEAPRVEPSLPPVPDQTQPPSAAAQSPLPNRAPARNPNADKGVFEVVAPSVTISN
jgi:class 3 adenylate cyclase